MKKKTISMLRSKGEESRGRVDKIYSRKEVRMGKDDE